MKTQTQGVALGFYLSGFQPFWFWAATNDGGRRYMAGP